MRSHMPPPLPVSGKATDNSAKECQSGDAGGGGEGGGEVQTKAEIGKHQERLHPKP